MKKFLSILLATLMILSNVSYAVPFAIDAVDAAAEADVPVIDFAEETQDEAELLAAPNYNKEFGKTIYQLHFDNAQDGESVSQGWNANALDWGFYSDSAVATPIVALYSNKATTLAKEGDNGFLHFEPANSGEPAQFQDRSAYRMTAGKVYTYTFDVRGTASSMPTTSAATFHKYQTPDANYAISVVIDNEWHTYSMTYTPAAGAADAAYKVDFSMMSNAHTTGTLDFDNFSVYEKDATATIKVVDAKGNVLATKAGVSTTGVAVSSLINDLYNADNQTATVKFNGKEYTPDDTIVFGGGSTIVLSIEDNADYNKEHGKNLYRLHFDNAQGTEAVGSGWTGNTAAVLLGWGAEGELASSNICLWANHATTLGKEENGNVYLHFGTLKNAEMIEMRETGSFKMSTDKVYTFTFDVKTNFTSAVAGYLQNNKDGSKVSVTFPADTEWHTYTMTYKPASADLNPDFSIFGSAEVSGRSFDVDNISIYEKDPTATIKVADTNGNILKTLENQNTATKIAVSTLIDGLYDANNQTAVVKFNDKEFSTADTITFGGNSTVVLEVADNAGYNKEYGNTLYRLHFDNAQGTEAVGSGWTGNDAATLLGWGAEGELASSDIRMWTNHATTLGKEENGNVYLHFGTLKNAEMVEMRENGSFTMSTDKVYTFSFDVKTGFTTAGTGKLHNYRDTSTNVNVTFPADAEWHTYTLTYKPTAAGQKPDFSIFGTVEVSGSSFDVDNISIYEKAATATINIVDSKGALLGTKTGVSTTGVAVSALIDGLYNAGDVVYVNFNGKDFLPEETIYFGGNSTITLVCAGEEPIEPEQPKVATVIVVDENGEPIVTLENVKADGILVSELISGLYDANDVSKVAYVIFNENKYDAEDKIVFGVDSTVMLVIEDNPYFSEKYGTILYQLNFDKVTNGASVGNGWQQAATWGTYNDSAVDFTGRMWLVNAGNTMIKEADNGFLRLNVPFGGDEIFNFHPETSNVTMKAGYTYTFTFDVRANAASFTPGSSDDKNYMYFAKAYNSAETTIIHTPNDNTWHTYSVSYTPSANEEWGKANGDYIYFFQKEWMSSGAGTFDIDNVTIYEMEAVPTTVKFDMQNGNSAASDLVIPDSAGYTVDANGNILMDPNSTLDLNTIASYVIDEGDMDFVGFNTDPDATTALGSVSASATGGEIQLYAVWAQQDVNKLYSLEFTENDGWSTTHNKTGDDTWANVNSMFGGNGSLYKANYAANPSTPIKEHGFITHSADGYITLNFDVSDPTAADGQTAANGNAYVDEAVIDSYFFLGSLDKQAYIAKNSGITKMVVRARIRGENALTQGTYMRVDNNDYYNYNPANFSLPGLYYTKSETDTVGSNYKNNTVDLTKFGTDTWFTYEIDVTDIFNSTDDIHTMRFDVNDVVPHGTKLDIDYIRFIGGSMGEAVSNKEKTAIKATRANSEKNGVRVVATVTDKLALAYEDGGASDIGYMITASAKWSKAGYAMEDLTMDKYNDSSINVGGKLIVTGFLRKDGVKQVEWFNDENDDANIFQAVLYGIPVKNYKSNFIARPFTKINGIYTYGEPFEVNFLDVANSVYDSEEVQNNPTVKYYIEKSNEEYKNYLAAAEVSGNIDESFASLLATPSAVTTNLIIPTNDTKPVKISDDYYTITAWKNGTMEAYTVYTKGTFPAIIDAEGKLSAAYEDEPCALADTGSGSYYLKSLAHSRAGSENGDPNGLNTSLLDFDGDSTTTTNMLVSHVDKPASPVQRLDKGSNDSSFFLGDYAYGTYEYNYGGGNTSELDMNLGKTALLNSNTKFVAKYVLPGETLWTTYAASQLNTLADNTDEWSNGEQGTAYFTTYPHGLEFNRLTYVVSNNAEKSDREDLVLLAGVMNFDNVTTSTSNSISGSGYDASLYKKILVKTTDSIDTVTVKFTRDDGNTGSITSTCYATVGDERLFDIDLYGVPEYHGSITKYNIYKNTSSSIGSNLVNVYLVANGHSSSATLTKVSSAFDDEGFGNGFVVRDLDQDYNKSSFTGTLGYFNAANQADVAWAVNPWYAYDYSNNSANKANYELTANGTTLSDAAGSKVIKYNSGVNINGTTSDTLTMTLNASKIYNGKTHSEMVNQGMTYWPHLLLEQNTEIPSVAGKQYAVNADRVKAEMDIRMTSMSNYGDNKTEFLVYVYLRPKAAPTQRIWFGIQLFSSSSTIDFYNWKRDTGASQYIYSIPQEVVFEGETNSFWTSKTSWGSTTYSVNPSSTWKHIDLDLTDHIDRALDWINREDGFGLGKVLTKDDIYIDGVNLGYETHGGVDATFEIANFNINSYSAN